MTEHQPSGPVWAKRLAGDGIDALNVAYCAGRDVRPRPEADRALIEHDLATNAAHALMLAETGILDPKQSRAILAALLDIRARHQRGEAILAPESEDVHMSIEALVTASVGPGAGGRLHTGRSRNDQVATDMRLWLREQIAELSEELTDLARILGHHARSHLKTVCPGMTHMQPAMVTTWGHWTAGYLVRILSDLQRLHASLDGLAACPLGGAASFGTSWPIDRTSTAEKLGFDSPTLHTAAPIWARGEVEAHFVFHAAQILGHLSGIGQDLILLSSPPRQWIRLDDAFVTGSSIMPQKRNPDFAEVTRARAATMAGHLQALLGIGIAAPGGYNRDSQWTKYIVMDAVAEVEGAPRLFARVVESLVVNKAAMRAACHEGFLNATDVADFLARARAMPFRDCYRLLGQAVAACESQGRLTLDALNETLTAQHPGTKRLTRREWSTLDDPVELLSLRDQIGSPKPDQLEESLNVLESEANLQAHLTFTRAKRWRDRISLLWEEVRDKAK